MVPQPTALGSGLVVADLLGCWLRCATVHSRDELMSRPGTNAWEAAVRPEEIRPKSPILRGPLRLTSTPRCRFVRSECPGLVSAPYAVRPG